MADSKTGHYVPKFYLKYFADETEQTYVFDKWDRKRYKTNISNVAAENYFYDIREVDEHPELDRKIVEREISKIEGFYANEYRKLVDTIDKRKTIPEEIVFSLSYYLTIQMVRTKYFREWMASGWRKVGQLMLDLMISQGKVPPPPNGLDIQPGDIILDVRDDAKSEIQSSFMFDPKTLHGLSDILARHIWIVGINDSDQPFYTCDHPVATVPSKEFGKFGYTGIAAPGIEIDFPITPDYMLVLLERTFYERSQRFDRKYIAIDRRKVNDLNLILTTSSYRQVYSKTPNFVLARLVCNNYPEHCKPRFE